MNKQRYSEPLSQEEFEAAYIRYACTQVSHNTMTRGEFAKQLETNKGFAKRFMPDHFDNEFDWHSKDIEIK